MDKSVIACDVCGAAVIVLHVVPVYASKMFDGKGGAFQHTLTETHYDIECPACGPRTQVVPAAQ
jgi:hypothetical protein